MAGSGCQRRPAAAWDGSGRPGALIEVADTGVGIPAHEQKRVFERFFRSTSAVREEVQGTGLGLALTQALVEDHDGLIELALHAGTRHHRPRVAAVGRPVSRGSSSAARSAAQVRGSTARTSATCPRSSPASHRRRRALETLAQLRELPGPDDRRRGLDAVR